VQFIWQFSRPFSVPTKHGNGFLILLVGWLIERHYLVARQIKNCVVINKRCRYLITIDSFAATLIPQNAISISYFNKAELDSLKPFVRFKAYCAIKWNVTSLKLAKFIEKNLQQKEFLLYGLNGLICVSRVYNKQQ